jgi:hypothetical protein
MLEIIAKTSLTLEEQHRLAIAVQIAQRDHLYRAVVCLDLFLAQTVATIIALLFRQATFKLAR